MAVQSAKNKFMSTEPLCLTCANAVPQACEFIRQKKPVPALEAMGAKYLSQEFTRSPGKGTYYKVTACPKYTRGPLPRIAKARGIEKLDLTCPKCNGSDKVKVAPTSLLEPAEWYCRCFRCNKAFRPKKKGDSKLQLVNEMPDSVNENGILSNENLQSANEAADLYNDTGQPDSGGGTGSTLRADTARSPKDQAGDCPGEINQRRVYASKGSREEQ